MIEIVDDLLGSSSTILTTHDVFQNLNASNFKKIMRFNSSEAQNSTGAYAFLKILMGPASL